MQSQKRIFASLLLCFLSPAALAIVAVDDRYVVMQDSFVTVDPFINDSIDFDTFEYPSPGDFQVLSGQATISVEESLTIMPGSGFVGNIEIEYQARDASGSDTARIHVEVVAEMITLQAVDDEIYIPAGIDQAYIYVLNNDIFPSEMAYPMGQITPSSSSQGGTVQALYGDGGDFLYTPPSDFIGVDSFSYTIENPEDPMQTDTATVTLYVGQAPAPEQPEEPTDPMDGFEPIPGLSKEEDDLYQEIAELCSQDSSSDLPCDEIRNLSSSDTQQLLQQVGGGHTKLQSRSMRQLQGRQGTNLRNRLLEIRSGSNRVSINGLNTVIFGQAVPLAKALQGELSNNVQGGNAGDNLVSPWGFFVNGNVTLGEGKERENRPGYDQDGYNVTMGLDYRFSETVVAGVAAGFSRSELDFDRKLGEQDSDSYSLSLFANYYPMEKVYIDGLLMYTQGALDVNRNVMVGSIFEQLKSDTDSQQYTLSTSAGYDFSHKRFQASLFGRLEYSDMSIDAYRESGGSFALAVAEQNGRAFDAVMGGRLGYVFNLSRGVVLPSLELEYVNRNEEGFTIRNSFMSSPGSQFRVEAEEPDTEYMNLSGSISAVFSGGRSGFFRYETMLLQDDYDVSSYSLGFRMEF